LFVVAVEIVESGHDALSHGNTREEAGRRDELPEGHQGVLHGLNDDGRTVAAMDVLASGSARSSVSSQREERLEVLDGNRAECHVDQEHFAWYRDLRR
jgi:hypothetical protein